MFVLYLVVVSALLAAASLPPTAVDISSNRKTQSPEIRTVTSSTGKVSSGNNDHKQNLIEGSSSASSINYTSISPTARETTSNHYEQQVPTSAREITSSDNKHQNQEEAILKPKISSGSNHRIPHVLSVGNSPSMTSQPISGFNYKNITLYGERPSTSSVNLYSVPSVVSTVPLQAHNCLQLNCLRTPPENQDTSYRLDVSSAPSPLPSATLHSNRGPEPVPATDIVYRDLLQTFNTFEESRRVQNTPTTSYEGATDAEAWTSSVALETSMVVSELPESFSGYVYPKPEPPRLREDSAVNCSNRDHQQEQRPGNVCGGVYGGTQFRVTSPNFPGAYPRNLQCAYFIQATAPDVCELEVTFLTFDVSYSENCDEDRLEVAGERLCGGYTGVRRFRFTPPRTVLFFRSGSTGSGQGFNLAVQQRRCASPSPAPTPQPACGGIFVGRQVQLQSPGYPQSYAPNLRCVYFLRAATLDVCELQIEFVDFAVEAAPGCGKDRLEVGDRDTLCGNQIGIRRYVGRLREVMLTFVSDGAVSNRGFRIVVTHVPCGTSTGAPTIWPPTNPIPPPIQPPIIPYPSPTSPPINPNPPPVQPPIVYPPPIQPPTVFPLPNPYPPPIQPPTVLPPINPYPLPIQPPINPYPSYINLPTCCGTGYNSRRFYLASPDFPRSVKQDIDCVYLIHRFSPSICTIRIQFKFFWLAEDNNNAGCPGGFLQMNGHRLCGCRTGLKLALDARQGSWPKVLRYKTDRRFNNRGFLLEVEQEECGHFSKWKKRSIDPQASANNSSYEDEFNIFDNVDKPDGNVEEMAITAGARRRRFLKKPADVKCSVWGAIQWLQQSAALCPTMPLLPPVPPPRCVELRQPQGSLQSPNYPWPYPANMQCCYRFLATDGSCGVELTMVDFALEDSANCDKDFFQIAGRWRFCGTRLAATTTMLELSGGAAEVRFVSDGSGFGRGFSARYRHVACTAPADLQPQTCDRVIRQESFSVSSRDVGPCAARCTFRVIRSNEDVCDLVLTLADFNLQCGQQYLQVGDQQLCGVLHGKQVRLDFYSPEVSLEFVSTRQTGAVAAGTFLVQGRQEPCPPAFEPTPQRRLVSQPCAVELQEEQGEVRGPSRDAGLSCTYNIQPRPGMCSCALKFSSFNVPASERCTNQFLQLGDSRFCGSQLPQHTEELKFHGSALEMPYRVSADPDAQWRFTYAQRPCPNVIS